MQKTNNRMKSSGSERLEPRSNLQTLQEFLGCKPKSTTGSMDAAAMCRTADGHKTSTRSAEKLVATVSERSVRGLGASASIVQLVESLIWPFVARRSLRTVWFSDKEFDHFLTSMRRTAQTLKKYESEDNREQTFLKYWLDRFLCQVFRDPTLPIREDWIIDPLFTGWLRRFVARRVASRDVSFIYSLQKGSKRFWPVLGEKKKEMALQKHKERLSTHHGFLPSDLEKCIERTAGRIWKDCNWKTEPTKFLPTGSACLQASRREGGALSLIRKFDCPLDSGIAAIIGKLPFLNAELNRWRQENYEDVARKAEVRINERGPAGERLALDVEVVAIPEPGKFRIITKGDGYLYSALQPLQGVLLDLWKADRSSTMRHDDLEAQVREMDQKLPDLPFWCSVDYEAATDLLKRDATVSAILPFTFLPSYRLAALSLFPGRAKYPDGTFTSAIEGQLMGHPLSFPILCVVNKAVYLCALKRWVDDASFIDRDEREALVPEMRRNVLVNGDDMLFKCDQSFYQVFLRTASDAGFKISQGKNYLSRDCCMINSQVFRRTGGVMKRFGYLNLKLVKGSSLKEGDSDAIPTQISRSVNEMVARCPWAACAIPAVFSRWSNDWFGPCYRPNWYLPVHLGGLGVELKFAPETCRITRDQREMAARFISSPSMALYRVNGIDIPTASMSGALAHWRIIPGPYVQKESESESTSDPWLARLAFAARAHHGSKGETDKAFVSRFKPQYRLKPMSIEGIGRYWVARLFATAGPSCPPLLAIRLRTS